MKRAGKINKITTLKSASIHAVDLFCGVGGLTHGLEKAGVKVTAGIDLDPHCRYPYEANNKAQFIQKDIRSLEAAELRELFEDAPIRLLAGCAPCQPFSTYSQSKRGATAAKDWSLLLEFGRLIRQFQPELVTMENVPQLLRNQVFSNFLESLNGYHLWCDVVECVEYGIPQTRKRLVLLGSRLGALQLIKSTHSEKCRPTVWDSIGHLPRLAAGRVDSIESSALCMLTESAQSEKSEGLVSWR